MNRFTNAEFADIHSMYDFVNRNEIAAVKMYRERFPSRLLPNPRMFAHVHQNLSEHESFPVPMLDTSCFYEDELNLVVSSHGPPYRPIYLLFTFFWFVLKAMMYETPLDSDLNPWWHESLLP
ncbi:hypothetical protein AVEN_203088-1 [Araneus ventricosus]|uniref:DUF4817 domain-containing protein n=1 Tax=Araneus ventricosus TaxID=182803 RepID=A0A4Y2DT79_ARAVE|nr:hypothetical protein AVEN_203088-1 [Araneus ventricosus]